MGGKKFLSFGRAVLYMLRKGLTAKSKTRVNRFEYEFSCSNSPVNGGYLFSKRGRRRRSCCDTTRDADHAVHKAFELFNEYDVDRLELPGFGPSPVAVRQLRVTDSPFLDEELEKNPQVDKDAEDFINQFYTRLQQER